MAWVELTLPSAVLSLRASGNILWNSALQLAMGSPEWVDLMWDSSENTIGIRAVNSPTGIPVHADAENSQFKIDSADILAAEEISVEEAVTDTPEVWEQEEAGGGPIPADWFGYSPIFYITLPE